MVVQAVPVPSSTVVVAVDVGKTEFAFSVTDSGRTLLLKPRTGCPMTGPSLAQGSTPQKFVDSIHLAGGRMRGGSLFLLLWQTVG